MGDDLLYRRMAAPYEPVLIEKVVTFREAAESYMENGGERKYLPLLYPHLGDLSLSKIVPFDVSQLAKKLYPTQANSTRNRSVINPVRAVFNHAAEREWGPKKTFRSFREDPPKRKKAASQAWLHAFIRQCGKDGLPHMAAYMMFTSQTGARVSEALNLRWQDVDFSTRTALLTKTKTERNSVRFLTDQLISRLHELKEGRELEDRVFRNKCRSNMNDRIKAICRRADIAYKPTHTCGRHAFANNALSLGVDIKSVMDAGGWKSPVVFLNTYVNPKNAGRVVADKMNLYQYDNDL